MKRTRGWLGTLLFVVLLASSWQIARLWGYRAFFGHLPMHSRWVAKKIDKNWTSLPSWTQDLARAALSTRYDFVRLTEPSSHKALFHMRNALTWDALSPDGRQLKFAEWSGSGLLYRLYSAREGEAPKPGPTELLGGWLCVPGSWHQPSGHVAMFESPQSKSGRLGFTWSSDSQSPVPLPPLQHDELVTLDAAGDNIALAFSYAKNATEPCIVHVVRIAGTVTQLEVDASLSTSASCFAASADGALIAFATQRELVRASVDLREGGRVQPKDRIALAKGVVPQHHVLSRDGRLSAIMTKAGEIIVFDWHKRALIGQSPVLKYRNATEARNADLRESGDLAISADLKRLYVVLNTYTVPPVRWQDTQNVWHLYSIELPSLD